MPKVFSVCSTVPEIYAMTEINFSISTPSGISKMVYLTGQVNRNIFSHFWTSFHILKSTAYIMKHPVYCNFFFHRSLRNGLVSTGLFMNVMKFSSCFTNLLGYCFAINYLHNKLFELPYRV